MEIFTLVSILIIWEITKIYMNSSGLKSKIIHFILNIFWKSPDIKTNLKETKETKEIKEIQKKKKNSNKDNNLNQLIDSKSSILLIPKNMDDCSVTQKTKIISMVVIEKCIDNMLPIFEYFIGSVENKSTNLNNQKKSQIKEIMKESNSENEESENNENEENEENEESEEIIYEIVDNKK